MKYKRKKYLSPTCDKSYPKEKSPKRFFPDLRRKSVIAGCFVTALFLLVQYDVIDRGILDTIVSSPYKFRESKAGTFISEVGKLTGEFCFGYLRNSNHSKNSVFANQSGEPEKSAESVQVTNKTTYENDTAENTGAATDSPPLQTDEAQEFRPVIPCAGKITSEFGERIHPVTGEKTTHNGIDIGCSSGETVKAVFDGIVERVEYNEFSGNFAVIKHQDGFTSSYSHMSEISVKEGENVLTGDAIGKSGSTGRVTGPHLHLEIRKNGEAINPFEYIR